MKNHMLDLNSTIACRVSFVVLLSEFELRSQGHVMDIRSCHSRIISIVFTSERPTSATGLHTVCVFPFRLFISVLSVGPSGWLHIQCSVDILVVSAAGICPARWEQCRHRLISSGVCVNVPRGLCKEGSCGRNRVTRCPL